MNHRKTTHPTVHRWLLRAFLAGAVLLVLLFGVAMWPLWLPLLDSVA